MIHDQTPTPDPEQQRKDPEPDEQNNEHDNEHGTHRPAVIERPDPLYAAVLFLLRQAKTHNRDIGKEADQHARTIADYFGAPEPVSNDSPRHDAANPRPSRRFRGRTS